MRDFIPAKRAATPSYSTAAANQGYLQMMEEENKRKQRHAAMKAPIDMYSSYTNLTGHNPLSDVLRKTNFGKNSESVRAARAAEAADIAKAAGGPGPGVPTAAATPSVNMAGGTAASTSVQGGDKLAAAVAANNATSTATKGASAAAKGASMGSKAIPIAGSVLGAGANYMDEKAKGSDDWRVAGKTLGGAAPGVLMAAGPALAAAGPPGWIGLAGLAAASLYGMLG